MENNLLVQLGSVLLTLVVTLLGIFKGLIPQLLGSFEKRLADKDKTLDQQQQALDEVCRERKELTDQFLRSLNDVVVQNSTSMSALTQTLFRISQADARRPRGAAPKPSRYFVSPSGEKTQIPHGGIEKIIIPGNARKNRRLYYASYIEPDHPDRHRARAADSGGSRNSSQAVS